MNETEALVARAEGDYIWLQSCVRHCEKCEDSGSCGITSQQPALQRVRNTVNARVGDVVVVGMATGAVLKAAALIYLLPLILALGASAIGLYLGGDGAALVGLVAGLTVGWTLARQAGRGMSIAGEPVMSLRLKAVVSTSQRK